MDDEEEDDYDYNYDDDDEDESPTFEEEEEDDLQEVTYCCGAYWTNTYFKESKAKDPQNYVMKYYRLGFLLVPEPTPGFMKICDGLYIRDRGPAFRWVAEDNYDKATFGTLYSSKRPNKYVVPGDGSNLLVRNILRSYINDTYNILGVKLIGNFPHYAYDKEEDFKILVEENSKQNVVAILATTQIPAYEWLLLENGFNRVTSSVNPKHNSRLVFYHRAPKGVPQKYDLNEIDSYSADVKKAKADVAVTMAQLNTLPPQTALKPAFANSLQAQAQYFGVEGANNLVGAKSA